MTTTPPELSSLAKGFSTKEDSTLGGMTTTTIVNLENEKAEAEAEKEAAEEALEEAEETFFVMGWESPTIIFLR